MTPSPSWFPSVAIEAEDIPLLPALVRAQGTGVSPVSTASAGVSVCLAPAAVPPPCLLGLGLQEPSDLFLENCGSQAGVNSN